MPHLAVPRRGWENEHLATFLLAKIAFVAHPLTVADDIGSDFFCTLFESSNENGMEVLFPRNSFAIQVKSRRENFAATNKIDYLLRLELPFFLGVVDRHTLRLDVYAAEHLPMMFSHLGRPRELTLCPLEPNEAGGTPPYHGSPDGPCTLNLRHVVELTAADDRDALRRKGAALSALCSRIHGNIATRTSQEYIFTLDQAGSVRIMAGPSSAETFRHNFCLRLAEVFYNLEWLLQNQPQEFSREEFEMYDRLYTELTRRPVPIPDILRGVRERLKQRLRA
jgi:hypothetical protein